MSTTINAVTSASIRHGEFVRLTVGKPPGTTVYTFCNAAAPIAVSGITFTGLSFLLGVGDVQRDIKSTSDDMNITLTGIDPAAVSLVLSSDIKGSLLEVWRGFFDSNNQIITTPTTQFFKRYQGIVSNVSITESWNNELRQRIATCSISSSSMRRIIENRLSGIKTNKASWQQVYPSDVSMNRVAEISNTYFDFGQPPKTNTLSSNPVDEQPYVDPGGTGA